MAYGSEKTNFPSSMPIAKKQLLNSFPSISNRMDGLADGSVSSCKLFSEFSVGSLYEKGVLELWESETVKKVRETIYGGLTPNC